MINAMNIINRLSRLLRSDSLPTILDKKFLSRLPADLANTLQGIQISSGAANHLLWNDYRVCSVFQPIVSFTHNCIVGHEALARPFSKSGEAVAPPVFFSTVRRDGHLAHVDRACRLLHILNAGEYPGWLFLNFHPSLFGQPGNEDITDLYLGTIIDHFGIDPVSIMIEVVESEVAEKEYFEKRVQQLRSFGFNIALDDFGTGESNFERLMSMQPDIVKLDRSFAQQCVDNVKIRKVLPRLVQLLHEIGSQVVLEGIETEAQALIALDANIDFGQGWFFARPQPCPHGDPYALTATLESLWVKHGAEAITFANKRKETLGPIFKAFEEMGSGMNSGRNFSEITPRFLNIHEAKRIYLLNGDGFIEIPPLLATCRANYERPCLHCNGGCPQITAPRFSPLPEKQSYMKRARLSRHSFFQRALEHHGKPQLSRPYVSPCDGNFVSTISMAITLGGKNYVMCGDLNWETLAGKL